MRNLIFTLFLLTSAFFNNLRGAETEKLSWNVQTETIKTVLIDAKSYIKLIFNNNSNA